MWEEGFILQRTDIALYNPLTGYRVKPYESGGSDLSIAQIKAGEAFCRPCSDKFLLRFTNLTRKILYQTQVCFQVHSILKCFTDCFTKKLLQDRGKLQFVSISRALLFRHARQ